MRRSTFPPRAARAEPAMRAPEPPKRKTFHCIVDDTALMAGVKKSTRDGIRKWVTHGSICLYVPLHSMRPLTMTATASQTNRVAALSQLQRLKTGNDRAHADSREAMKWLDDITSVPGEVAERVKLQGGEEEYPTWAEVEKFLLPETLLSMEESESEEDDYHDDLESSFNALDVSDETSMSSTHSMDEAPRTPESPKSPRSLPSRSIKSTDDAESGEKAAPLVIESPARSARGSNELPRPEKAAKGAVPVYLQPLFNHVLWRVNKEDNPDAALESMILLTNDPAKQAIAQKFGVRAKRLEQLRDAVAREDREYRNHLTIYELENQTAAPAAPKAPERPTTSYTPEPKAVDSDDEDVVLFQRAPRGPAAAKNNHQVLDPHDFSRTNQHPSPRGGRGGHVPPRGRGGPPPFRGRGNFAPRGAYVAPGPAFRTPPAPRHDPNQPLDPNSFSRPATRATPVRGGGGRKLWEPN
jgi:hypothetical protein